LEIPALDKGGSCGWSAGSLREKYAPNEKAATIKTTESSLYEKILDMFFIFIRDNNFLKILIFNFEFRMKS
jgi:hypothetical protein